MREKITRLKAMKGSKTWTLFQKYAGWTKKDAKERADELARLIWLATPNFKTIAYTKTCWAKNLGFCGGGYRQTIIKRGDEFFYAPYWAGFSYKKDWLEVVETLEGVLEKARAGVFALDN